MPTVIEAELKFRAETDAPLRALALADGLGPARLGPASEVDEQDRYLDTADGRLAAAGWACRLRSRAGATHVSLKGPAQHAAGAAMHERPELEGPAHPDLPVDAWQPSPAREWLLRITDGHPLRERLTLHQRRTERPVAVGGSRAGLLSLDRVRVEHDGLDRGGFLEVELEFDGSALDGGLDPTLLTAALLATPGLTREPSSKLERALALLEDGGA